MFYYMICIFFHGYSGVKYLLCCKGLTGVKDVKIASTLESFCKYNKKRLF